MPDDRHEPFNALGAPPRHALCSLFLMREGRQEKVGGEEGKRGELGGELGGRREGEKKKVGRRKATAKTNVCVRVGGGGKRERRRGEGRMDGKLGEEKGDEESGD